MRIPNTAEVLTFFAAIGQFSNLPSADSEFSLAPADADIADSEFSVIPAGSADGADDADLEYPLVPTCARAYTVKSGDNCYSIAGRNGVPTYQIICQNGLINGMCSNLRIGQHICLGHRGDDCKQTAIVKGPSKSRNVQSIAKQFNIPLQRFMENNYCYHAGPGKDWVCPRFRSGSVVCIAQKRVRAPGKCAKIF